MLINYYTICIQGRIQDFKLGGALKKLRRAEGGANIFGVFRVKNHDITPKNHIFSNFRGGGGGTGCAPPPWIRPWYKLLGLRALTKVDCISNLHME